MNPTLISGFEDIITHIKQQEQRIMNLEENEKVREARVQELCLENKKLKETIDEQYEFSYFKKMKDLQAENKKLKENLKLSEDKVCELTHEINDRVVIEDIAIAFGSDAGEDFDWESEIGGMVMDNKKLKEQMEAFEGYEEDSDEEEEKCEECGKCLEGEDKCGEGCPAYDKGWLETHPKEES